MGAEQDNHLHPHVRRVLRPFRVLLSLPVWLYQRLISPALPGHCIYTPSCSEYVRQAILRFGIAGLFAGLLRIGRCVGGLYHGGDDPVPERLTASYLFGSYRRRWKTRHNEPH